MPTLGAILHVVKPVVLRGVEDRYRLSLPYDLANQRAKYVVLTDVRSGFSTTIAWTHEDDIRPEREQINLATELLRNAMNALTNARENNQLPENGRLQFEQQDYIDDIQETVFD